VDSARPRHAPRYRLDTTYRRYGSVVVGGSPLILLRVTAAAGRLFDLLERGGGVESASPAELALLDRLTAAGIVHPLWTAVWTTSGRPSLSDVSIVVPSKGRWLPEAVTMLMGEPGPSASASAGVAASGEGEEAGGRSGPLVILVDDGSDAPLAEFTDACQAAPARGSVRRVRRDVCGGPAAARNTGLAEVTTPYVAFVDTDVVGSVIDAIVTAEGSGRGSWLEQLLAHFADDTVVAVAPRVASRPGTSLLARYESRRSPLDLGGEPARVAPGSRVSYLPSAALVCRTDALRAIDGFNESMRFGEDVDAIWRLIDCGGTIRYDPAVTLHHEPRQSWLGWIRQRIGYGSSAAELAARHGDRVAPVRLSRWTAVVVGAVLLRRPVVAAAVAAYTAVALRRKLPSDIPSTEVLRLVGRGHLGGLSQVASATRRGWWPFSAVAALVWPRWRPAAAVMMVAPIVIRPLADARRAGPRGAGEGLGFGCVEIGDDVSYSLGVWKGMARRRALLALLPKITAWPTR
jgi:mycofactocin glycosyltransferase